MALVIEPANSLALWRRGEAKRELGDIQGAMGDLKLGMEVELGQLGSTTSGVEVVRVVWPWGLMYLEIWAALG